MTGEKICRERNGSITTRRQRRSHPIARLKKDLVIESRVKRSRQAPEKLHSSEAVSPVSSEISLVCKLDHSLVRVPENAKAAP